MRSTIKNSSRLLGMVAVGLTVVGVASTAQAGRGGSPEKIASAIHSGSADAIAAELERSEYLVCAVCVDYVSPLIDDANPKVRQVAAWWLARRGVTRQIFTDMLWRLSQPDSVKARNAADVLGELGAPQAIPALGAAMSNPAFTPEARVAMARALGTIGRPAARPALVGALGDAEPSVRAAALGALRALPGRDATEAVPMLGDADASVRVQAIFVVGAFGAREATPALVGLLQNDPNAGVRKRAAWALGEMGAPQSIAGETVSRAARTDSSPLVRSLAAIALTKLTR